ncbi:SMI1/KNR4 family protein [Methylobacterium sp. J-030]|uniref:SMI1/KNR4 family protein n=1 Tax=Methylobacterium sp. J-030 TaxID=2836627 RepID=UPI001FBAC6EE|nr:SMI1/KNR4 family protein [Methylobacterium sp. J-030]MCJ2073493.1 SMI1/KNR4 family protein [Methylobacterium sp. J-030]
MWERIFTSLSPGFASDEAGLDGAAAELGFALPESYRSFCRTCGVGLAGEQFRIAVPGPYPASDLITQAGVIAHSVGSAIGMLEDGAEPHRFDVEGGDPGVVERACFFGRGDDGGLLFWDVTGGGPEYDIWLLAPDLETIRFGGESLTDFFARVTGPAAALVLGPGFEPLPARFAGVTEAILMRSMQADS